MPRVSLPRPEHFLWGARCSPSESLLPPCVEKSLVVLSVMSVFSWFLSTLYFLYVLTCTWTTEHMGNEEDRNVGMWCDISLPVGLFLPNVSPQLAPFYQ